jgi:hypothetical protein
MLAVGAAKARVEVAMEVGVGEGLRLTFKPLFEICV